MKPYSKLKANGELRFSTKPAKPVARSRATNNVLSLRGVNGHSAKARRFRDLIRAHLDGLADPDQGAISLARNAALASIRIESLQARIIANEDIDDAKFVRLTLGLGRALRQLNALKQQQQARAQPPAGSAPGSALNRLLAEMTEPGAHES
jgi:hypothetical protein